MREITIRLYTYAELSEKAKEKARNWWLSCQYWPDEVKPEIDNWKDLAKDLGVFVKSSPWWDIEQGYFMIGKGSFVPPDDADLDKLMKDWSPSEVLNLISSVREIRKAFRADINYGTYNDAEIIAADDPELGPLEDAAITIGDLVAFQIREDEIYDEEIDKFQNFLSNLQALGLSWIKAQIEYLESEENIEETMAANEYEFLENGTKW